ncbi:PTS system trehalose-specific EIIBC component [Blautia schinkii]|nr:PTS system trehalose-specific EIIBC component [Blautia schinkii]
MGKYAEDAKELLRLIGGKENIAAVSHCMTRMRFALVDPAKADVKAIEAMKVVKGSFTQSGQFQVIIGNTVADFYNDFVKAAGIEGVSKDAVKQAAKKNQNVLQRIITALAEIFAPLIPAIITGGLILGFRNCIDSLYLFENGTKTLCDISQFWSGIDSFLWLIGEAIFHMLPVGICWSVTKKMGTTQMLGIVLGLTLVSGQLLNAYAVAGTAAADIPKWNFGGFQVNMIGYQGQVIPAILAAFTLVYLEKFFRKITPQVISMIVVPFCSLLLSVIAAHFVLGPIGWKIGAAVSSVVFAGITGTFKVVFGAVFGVVYAPLVITGLHHMSNAIDLQLIADYGGTMLWPMIALSNIAQGSAVLGMIWLQKKNPEAQEVNIPACISCYLGVTEPAIFGVNLKRGFPFVCGMIGSGIAAVVCVATGTTANAIGVGGIPGILSIQTPYMASFAICMLIAFAVPFLLTAVVGKKRLQADKVNETVELSEIAAGAGASAVAGVMAAGAGANAATGVTAAGAGASAADCIMGAGAGTSTAVGVGTSAIPEKLTAFLAGKVIPLAEVGDGVFSEGIMGDGMAIIPENETLYAPVDAEVAVLMPESKHACGLKLDNGMEILLHIGIDTVGMNGDGFEYLVEEGQKVSAGTPLIKFDRAKIKAAGHPDVTVCIVTEEGNAQDIQFHTGMNVKVNETTVASFK